MSENTPFVDIESYVVGNEHFWGLDNVTIQFIFFKNRLYEVAIDYTPTSGSDFFDTEAADKSMDLLMLNHAKEYYGVPKTIENEGMTFYVWRGRRGSVMLYQDQNVLALIDSQLLIEYNAATRKHGP